MAEDIDPSAPDLQINPTDKRIDVGAKFALQRMLKVPDTALDAARLIRGINGGTLAGIFGDDLLASVKVAQAHGTQRWLLVPKGEDAALVLDAAAPLDAPPTLIFRGDTPDIRNKQARLDPALQKASRTFDLWQRQQIGPCAASASAVPVRNLVPSSFCHLPTQDLLVIITKAGEPGSVLAGARVEVEGPSPSLEVKTQLTDAAGKAEFSDLPLGSYQVRATKDRFQNASIQILLGSDSQPDAFTFDGDIGAPSADAPTAGANTVTLQLSPQTTQLILIEHPDQKLPNAPALTDEARWGVLRKGGTPADGSEPLPDISAWEDMSVRVDRSPLQKSLLFAVDSDSSGGDPRNGETTIHSAAGHQVDIISNGVHKAPIRWHVTSAQPLGSVDGVQEARLTGRVRFSLYAAPHHIVESNLSTVTNKADDIVDDLSLLITVQNTENMNAQMEPDWDVARQPTKKTTGLKPSEIITEQQVIKIYKDVIDRCHAHRIQVLAGYSLVRDGVPRIIRFDKWLDDLTNHADGGKAEATRFANALVNFIDSKMPGFDGISFDIESCGMFAGSPLVDVKQHPSTNANKDKIAKLRRTLRFFYHAVADLLAVDNRICAITVGGMMSDDAAALALPTLPRANVQALLAARLHTYDLPIGKPNIIIRPMAYDNAGRDKQGNFITPAFNRDPAQFEWHKAIVEFALKQKRINPQQFQLAIKDFTPHDKITGKETGQGGTVPEPSRILHRCTEILRPNRVGLILFAMFQPPNGEPWDNNSRYNKALNADPSGNPIPRPRAGQPLQVPREDIVQQ